MFVEIKKYVRKSILSPPFPCDSKLNSIYFLESSTYNLCSFTPETIAQEVMQVPGSQG